MKHRTEARKIGKGRVKGLYSTGTKRWLLWGFGMPTVFALGALAVTQGCVHKIQELETQVEEMATSDGQMVLCSVFKPITWSDHDTPETRKQIVTFNKGWDSLCRPKD